MKRRRVILIAVASLAAVVVAFVVRPGEKEPEYQGKKLSEWLEEYESARNADWPENPSGVQKAKGAVRAIGTNAIPYLLKWIQYETPDWRFKLHDAVDKLPSFIGDNSIVEHATRNRNEERAERATLGFIILRESASNAVPSLVKLLDNPNCPVAGCRALESLPVIGKGGLEIILQRIRSDDLSVRYHAIMVIGSRDVGTNGAPAVPVLLGLLESDNCTEMAYAAHSLSELRLQPGVVVPALLSCLQHSRAAPAGEYGPIMRQQAAMNALAGFGAAAKAAVPALQEIAAAPWEPLSGIAQLSLDRIAADASTGQ